MEWHERNINIFYQTTIKLINYKWKENLIISVPTRDK